MKKIFILVVALSAFSLIISCSNSNTSSVNTVAPDPPTFNIDSVTTNSITITVTGSSNTGTRADNRPASIIGYRAYYSTTDTFNPYDIHPINPGLGGSRVSTSTISTLSSGQTYYIKVITITDDFINGDSEFSSVKNTTTN